MSSWDLCCTIIVAIGKGRFHAALWKLPISGDTQTPVEEPSLHFTELAKVTSLGTAADAEEFGDMKGYYYNLHSTMPGERCNFIGIQCQADAECGAILVPICHLSYTENGVMFSLWNKLQQFFQKIMKFDTNIVYMIIHTPKEFRNDMTSFTTLAWRHPNRLKIAC